MRGDTASTRFAPPFRRCGFRSRATRRISSGGWRRLGCSHLRGRRPGRPGRAPSGRSFASSSRCDGPLRRGARARDPQRGPGDPGPLRGGRPEDSRPGAVFAARTAHGPDHRPRARRRRARPRGSRAARRAPANGSPSSSSPRRRPRRCWRRCRPSSAWRFGRTRLRPSSGDSLSHRRRRRLGRVLRWRPDTWPRSRGIGRGSGRRTISGTAAAASSAELPRARPRQAALSVDLEAEPGPGPAPDGSREAERFHRRRRDHRRQIGWRRCAVTAAGSRRRANRRGRRQQDSRSGWSVTCPAPTPAPGPPVSADVKRRTPGRQSSGVRRQGSAAVEGAQDGHDPRRPGVLPGERPQSGPGSPGRGPVPVPRRGRGKSLRACSRCAPRGRPGIRSSAS